MLFLAAIVSYIKWLGSYYELHTEPSSPGTVSQILASVIYPLSCWCFYRSSPGKDSRTVLARSRRTKALDCVGEEDPVVE